MNTPLPTDQPNVSSPETPLRLKAPNQRVSGPAFCHRCNRITETVFLPLSSGHIGRCCAACRATRKGHPFISRRELETTNAVNYGRRGTHGLPIRKG